MEAIVDGNSSHEIEFLLHECLPISSKPLAFPRVYIIMEYARNGSLLDVIRRDTYIDELRSRRWFRQLLEAINYCHEQGIVHR